MTTRAVHLRCEYLRDPIGIGVARPRLSWRTETDIQYWRQVGYQIEARDPDGQMFWNSGRVDSADSLFVPYGGLPLASGQRCEWRVRRGRR